MRNNFFLEKKLGLLKTNVSSSHFVCPFAGLKPIFKLNVMAKIWFSYVYLIQITGHFTLLGGPDLVRVAFPRKVSVLSNFKYYYLNCIVHLLQFITLAQTRGGILPFKKGQKKKAFSAQSKAGMRPPQEVGAEHTLDSSKAHGQDLHRVKTCIHF
jgi:hypothetical protein